MEATGMTRKTSATSASVRPLEVIWSVSSGRSAEEAVGSHRHVLIIARAVKKMDRSKRD